MSILRRQFWRCKLILSQHTTSDHHSNGVSLEGRWWPAFRCWLGCCSQCVCLRVVGGGGGGADAFFSADIINKFRQAWCYSNTSYSGRGENQCTHVHRNELETSPFIRNSPRPFSISLNVQAHGYKTNYIILLLHPYVAFANSESSAQALEFSSIVYVLSTVFMCTGQNVVLCVFVSSRIWRNMHCSQK